MSFRLKVILKIINNPSARSCFKLVASDFLISFITAQSVRQNYTSMYIGRGQVLFQNLFLTYSPPILGRINDFDKMSVVLKSIEFSEDRPNLAVDDVFRRILIVERHCFSNL